MDHSELAGALVDRLQSVFGVFRYFTCPSCGGSYFTTWELHTPRERKVCRDQYGGGCTWQGTDPTDGILPKAQDVVEEVLRKWLP